MNLCETKERIPPQSLSGDGAAQKPRTNKSRPLAATDLKAEDRERFWLKVNKDGPIPPHRPELGPCWTWTGNTFRRGYGQFPIVGRSLTAHRASYALEHGMAKGGLMICHHCDNPKCVNPKHLFEGTGTDNNLDCASKGRNAMQVKPGKGAGNHNAKLTDRDVLAIRESALSTKALSSAYGVGEQTIRKIKTRVLWNHL